ncbi:MAG: OmpA family protein [Proteobacteria bacterium]|nr:OmpA family protein [Pseudomonadota bacterium]
MAGGLGLAACSEVPDWANPAVWGSGDMWPIDTDGEAAEETDTVGPPGEDVGPPGEDVGLLGEDVGPLGEDVGPPGEDEDFPTLGSVPDQAPSTTPPEETERLQAGLIADREFAQYTDEVLRGETPSGPAPPPDLELAAEAYLTTAPGGAPTTYVGSGGVLSIESFKARFNEEFDASGASRYVAPQASAAEGDADSQLASIESDDFDVIGESYLTELDRLPVPGLGYKAGVVYFANGQSWLSSTAKRTLRDVAQTLKGTNSVIRVVGHASLRTRDMDLARHKLVNFELSVDRARTVAQELIRQGVPLGRVFVEARGDSEPVTHEIMPAGEAENRRAEIFISY